MEVMAADGKLRVLCQLISAKCMHFATISLQLPNFNYDYVMLLALNE